MAERGIINPDDEPWFPAAKFDGYLWDKGDCVYISFIESKKPNSGNLSQLFDTILSQGKAIKVPTPFARMKAILEHKKFSHTVEDTEMGGCDVWVKSP